MEYESSREHYGAEDLRQKAEFVRDALADPAIRSVLDLGCNTGEYSVLAANLGKSVVAADADDASIQRLYERRRGAATDISPMVLNIARPPPALGWMNAEVPSFIDRATARFDCVIALGLIHHLAVTERVPLALIAQLLQRLTTAVPVVDATGLRVAAERVIPAAVFADTAVRHAHAVLLEVQVAASRLYSVCAVAVAMAML